VFVSLLWVEGHRRILCRQKILAPVLWPCDVYLVRESWVFLDTKVEM